MQLMIGAASGTLIELRATTKGGAPGCTSSHGTMQTIRAVDAQVGDAPQTVESTRAMARSGSADSTAAMVAISTPIIEKKTVVTVVMTATAPLGNSPPWALHMCYTP